MLQVVVAQPRGFCAGVVRAIKIVELALEQRGQPVYIKHPIVHNRFVVDRLEHMGAITVDSLIEVPEGATVVFSAHGSTPGAYRDARERRLQVIDATCPLVTKVHNEVKKYAGEGRAIVVIGHSDHVETMGTVGHSSDSHARTVVLDPDQFDRDSLQFLQGGVSGPEIAVVTQTTLSRDDVAPAVDQIKQHFPGAVVRDDICYATTNRQDAVKQLAQRVDIVLIVGSPTSSNCNRLVEVAKKEGLPALLIEGPDDVYSFRQQWPLENRIGISSGASTPEDLVEDVIAKLNPEQVTYLEGPEESITFKLPKELQ